MKGVGCPGAGLKDMLNPVNVDKVASTVTLDAMKGKALVLHPVHTDAAAAEKRPADSASYVRASGAFTIPPRTALVCVVK